MPGAAGGGQSDRQRFHCWLNAERNAAFFADRVLLVEGFTDKAVYLWLLARYREQARGVTVLDCGPKQNIPHFMKLFGDFGIEHYVVHDDDHNKTPNHERWNKTIQEARNEFTLGILPVRGNMEEFLSIPKAEGQSMKPVTAVAHLEDHGIDHAAEEDLLQAIRVE